MDYVLQQETIMVNYVVAELELINVQLRLLTPYDRGMGKYNMEKELQSTRSTLQFNNLMEKYYDTRKQSA